jgi:hypothetical protein
MTNEMKASFYSEFITLRNDAIWVKLNANNAKAIENWIDLKAINAIDRTSVDLLIYQKRVDGIKKYYTIEALKDKVEALPLKTRLTFLDNFDYTNTTIFNKFVNNPELITYWNRYFDDKILWDEFKKLSEARRLEFLDDYGNCSATVFNKFKANTKLIKHWDETQPSHISARNDIKFLEGRYHVYEKDLPASDHLFKPRNRPESGKIKFKETGGHREVINLNGTTSHITTSTGLEILDPKFNHIIDNATTSQSMKNYLNNTQNNLNIASSNGSIYKYKKTNLSNGHFEHEDILFKVDPPVTIIADHMNNGFVLNGQLYYRKPTHTQYKSAWTEDYMKDDMAYAIANKQLKPSTPDRVNPLIESSKHDLNQQWIETTYRSKLIDGTNVELKHVTFHRYNLQPHFYDHYSYFVIIN